MTLPEGFALSDDGRTLTWQIPGLAGRSYKQWDDVPSDKELASMIWWAQDDIRLAQE